MYRNPQAIEPCGRRLHYLRQSGLFILFAKNLIMRIPEEFKISNQRHRDFWKRTLYSIV
jgi:hypothetical protein